MWERAKEEVKYFGIGLGRVSIGLYIIPSADRYMGEKSESRQNKEKSTNKKGGLGSTIGIFSGIAGWVGQLHLYLNLGFDYDMPEIALIPVVTNIASFVYERGRKNGYKKATEQSKSIDSVAEEI